MTVARLLSIALLTLLTMASAIAQTDPLAEALRRYQGGELQQARTLIDEAIVSPAQVKDPEAWLLRGFIYKDLLKGMPGGEQADAVRDTALVSLMTCLDIDAEGTYRDNAVQAYDFLARSCFNDAAKALNDMQEERAVLLFQRYKDATLARDPNALVSAREVEFTNALGTQYTKRFNKDRQELVWFDKAVEAYKRVLAIDPENYGANYNLATLYYNRGVYKIRAIDAEFEIPTIQEIQEASREFFQLALPYMLKAHDKNPSRREILLGLEGIYYSLQDQESSDRFRELYELLPPENDQ
jgi:tetratricopeptide (TPR) repeat protein